MTMTMSISNISISTVTTIILLDIQNKISVAHSMTGQYAGL